MMELPKLETLPGILNDPHLLLSQIRRFTAQCIKVLDAGEQPDLMGLDDQVKILCSHVSKMELKDAEAMQPKMDSLVAELDQLAKAIGRERALVAEQLNDLNRQRQALGAYKKVDASVPLPADGER